MTTKRAVKRLKKHVIGWALGRLRIEFANSSRSGVRRLQCGVSYGDSVMLECNLRFGPRAPQRTRANGQISLPLSEGSNEAGAAPSSSGPSTPAS